jgi:hypothetical protein
MEAIRELFRKPIVSISIGVLIGLILGWFVIGWWLWPVEWTDASPADLRADEQETYLRLAIDSFALHGDQAEAQKRWEALGAGAEAVFTKILETPGQQASRLTDFQNAVMPAETPAEQPAEEESKGSGALTFLLVMCLVTLILAGALAAYFLFRQQRVVGEASPAVQAQEISKQAERTDYTALGESQPFSQFVTTYMLGDDLFDDSFSIDSPTGEFLGECGVGISESIGVGEPKKVSAFEIWLFDKNDIQTVTKVLMSQHAYDDAAVRQRLSAKGDPFLADPGGVVELETATLRLVARVVDMAYGSGAMPANSFFERITLEIAVWQK